MVWPKHLKNAGQRQVKYFGLSNKNKLIELLIKFVKQSILFNQHKVSITNAGMMDAGVMPTCKQPPGLIGTAAFWVIVI